MNHHPSHYPLQVPCLLVASHQLSLGDNLMTVGVGLRLTLYHFQKNTCYPSCYPSVCQSQCPCSPLLIHAITSTFCLACIISDLVKSRASGADSQLQEGPSTGNGNVKKLSVSRPQAHLIHQSSMRLVFHTVEKMSLVSFHDVLILDNISTTFACKEYIMNQLRNLGV